MRDEEHSKNMPMNNESQLEVTKARGAFFTPQAIAEFLASWAIHSSTDRVLEPSCGDAVFLLGAAGERAKLGGTKSGDLVGVELHAPSVARARHRLQEAGVAAEVVAGDFFDYSSDRLFDVVLGNPPFVRYQTFAGEGRLKAIAAALRQGVRLNKLASAWAAFLIHACSFLKPDGRLGLVLPAELLAVNYAATVRSYLMGRFSSLKIVTFEHHVFPGVQEEIVLLLASGSGRSEKFDLLQAKNLEDLEGSLGKRWSYFKPQRVDEKWTYAFIPEDVLSLYRDIGANANVEPLSFWGRAYLGAVTGANKFFLLNESEAVNAGLDTRDLTPILPPGSAHLKGLELSKVAWNCLRKDGDKVFLFFPSSMSLSKAASRYVALGEVDKFDNGYKCRVRKPWWKVPLVEKPDLFISYMTQDGVRLIANTANLEVTNSHYGLQFTRGRKTIGGKLLPTAALNSLTLLGSEMEGRSYGGGLLKIEPREVERLPLPSLSLVAQAADDLEAVMPHVAIKLRREKLASVCQTVDDVLLRNGMGLSQSDIRDLRGARRALFERRTGRSKRRK
jgi:adenine-specific DNA-methyltransferase